MKTLDIDKLTVVELPDRHVMSPVILVVVDVHGNILNVLSFSDLAAALNACGTQLGGNVLSISNQGQSVTCQAGANA